LRSSTRSARIPEDVFQQRVPGDYLVDAEAGQRLRYDRGAAREIIASLNFLEEQGYLKLQVAACVRGYRLKREAPDLTPVIES